ncbi:RNA polymerase sigma factor [Salirhabdus sp. Marseille-P4669]|uniref:RNA polymerase sigma factor n=1 Tax=Salirhabdus sp. Marseille-P4669 TaxID=2042310 RepID=UPI000C7A3F46|nr:RNA polymerase sigma factor [Salirhabdus sp. Marseille-P4669]
MSGDKRTDEYLIKGIQEGSIQDFQTLYEKYFPYIYKIVFSLLKNEADTLDVCQDLFLEYYQKAHTYRKDKGTVKAWLAVRAKSRTIDFIRKKSRVVLKDQVTYNDHTKSTENTVEDTVITNLERERLLQLLEGLPPLQREALYLNYGMSMSHRETAKLLNKPLGTIKSSIRYGLNHLRKNYITSKGLTRGDQHDA